MPPRYLQAKIKQKDLDEVIKGISKIAKKEEESFVFITGRLIIEALEARKLKGKNK